MKHVFALVLVAGTACAARRAAASGFAFPAPGARLDAGRSLVASFEPTGGLFGVEEMELVLSLDGGATFPLRLTGELSPGARLAGWRVPSLPTSQAVLGLRAGHGDAGERIVLESGIFTILADPSVPSDDIRFAGGEWRTREAGFGEVFPFTDGSMAGEPDGRFSALARETALTETRSPTLLLSSRADVRPADAPAVSSLSSPILRVPRVPVLLPRRE